MASSCSAVQNPARGAGAPYSCASNFFKRSVFYSLGMIPRINLRCDAEQRFSVPVRRSMLGEAQWPYPSRRLSEARDRSRPFCRRSQRCRRNSVASVPPNRLVLRIAEDGTGHRSGRVPSRRAGIRAMAADRVESGRYPSQVRPAHLTEPERRPVRSSDKAERIIGGRQ